eukprot:7075098-Pyramimonas_sp.AAC.1
MPRLSLILQVERRLVRVVAVPRSSKYSPTLRTMLNLANSARINCWTALLDARAVDLVEVLQPKSSASCWKEAPPEGNTWSGRLACRAGTE